MLHQFLPSFTHEHITTNTHTHTCKQGLADIEVNNQDQRVGVNIVAAALRVPCKTIVKNAGGEGDVVVGKLLEAAQGSTSCTKGT